MHEIKNYVYHTHKTNIIHILQFTNLDYSMIIKQLKTQEDKYLSIHT